MNLHSTGIDFWKNQSVVHLLHKNGDCSCDATSKCDYRLLLNHDKWTAEEITNFNNLRNKHGDDYYEIAKGLKTRMYKQIYDYANYTPLGQEEHDNNNCSCNSGTPCLYKQRNGKYHSCKNRNIFQI